MNRKAIRIVPLFALLSVVVAADISTYPMLANQLTVLSVSRTRFMENLNRGVVAVSTGSNSNFISWRMLGTDPKDIGFNIYRNGTKINSTPITNSTNYIDNNGNLSSVYQIAPVIDDVEQDLTDSSGVWSTNYLSIPLNIPAGVTTPDDVTCTYNANDCSIGDLDGDGEYEIVVKWDPSNSHDNSEKGYTGNVYLDAYELDGTQLWRIDMGINIRAGAHYTQFIVYDLDSDGFAEVACRTAPYTKDGLGNYVLLPGDALTDYRNTSGYILTGPEYLTIFNGLTGEAMVSTDFYPNRVDVNQWGDNYGNRCDRFLAGVAYIDGQRPSLIMARGYYAPKSGYSARNEIAAYNWRDGVLSQVWYFKAHLDNAGDLGGDIYPDYIGQGCHSLSINDVDGDGFDEIVYGSCVIDHDGTPLYSTGLGHGDALHVTDLDPSRPGLEVWMPHEGSASGASFRDAALGTILFEYDNEEDVGRGCAGDVTAAYPGCEVWASGSPLYSCTGTVIGSRPRPINFMIWWDGDDLRELLDGSDNSDETTPPYISKYGGSTLLSASGCYSNNTTKATPCLSGDILGDWREEVIWRTSDNSALRLYTTTSYTSRRLFTLMHDCQYRESIAWQNVAYNQPPHTSFFLGDGMADPPQPNIILAGVPGLYGDFTYDNRVDMDDLPDFISYWLEGECSLTSSLDLNEDCVINNIEFSAISQNWSGPDLTPPTVPFGLTVIEGDNTVTLNWFDNYEDDFDGFNVYRSNTSGSGYSKINTAVLTGPTYTDTDVINGSTYYYVVTAVDIHANESAYSVEISASPTTDTTITIQEEETGFIGVYTGDPSESNNAGYTGIGYVNTDNDEGMYISWAVIVPQDGDYVLQWRFANGGSGNRSGYVSVNGNTQAAGIDLASTGSWTSWSLSDEVTVSLEAGANVINLVAETGDGLANIDWISITGLNPVAGEAGE